MVNKNKLRIGIDGFNLGLEKGTGVATYARTLSQALSNMGHEVDVFYGLQIPAKSNPDLREVRFFDRLGASQDAKSPKLFSKRWLRERKADLLPQRAVEVCISNRVDARSLAAHLPTFNRIFNADNLFNRAARHFRHTGKFTSVRMKSPPDIMHWTYPMPIEIVGAKNIYTLHDVVPLRLPHTTLDDTGYYFRLLKNISVRAHGICTVSEASLRDILSFFPSMAWKLHNTYQACDTDRHAYKRSDEECRIEVRAEFGLESREYFLFFGSLEPKKNIGRIIEAFLAAGSDRKLVIVGAMAWKSEKELRYLDRGISMGKIIKFDYLPEHTLFALIRHARGLLFPSLSEGFGLPVLEAMLCGTPTLISNEGSLPEIGGAAALTAEAYNVESIAEGIRRLDRDDALCKELSDAGYDQANKFSMVSYQKNLARMYDATLSVTRKI
ncbi:glycosyltransferase family 4 protein [Asaia siamensis]